MKRVYGTISVVAVLIAAGCVQTPPELANDPTRRLNYQFEQLPGLLKAAGVTAKRAVCAIPCAQMVCRHMQVQPEGKRRMGYDELLRGLR